MLVTSLGVRQKRCQSSLPTARRLIRMFDDFSSGLALPHRHQQGAEHEPSAQMGETKAVVGAR
jgi:hypothetical protein